MMRYVRLLGVQLRASFQLAMQYRVDFLVGGTMSLFWLTWNLLPMVILWRSRPAIAGWTFPEALLVAAWFTLLRGLLEGAVQPSLIAVVEHIRKGTLDFVLLKPADAQFLISTSKFEPWRALDALGACGMMWYALHALGRSPRPMHFAMALALTVASAALLYALAILVVSAAFWVVRLDNLIYLFNSVFDAGRWPAAVFRGAWRLLFTFVIPLALMTTYPAEALLGRLAPSTLGLALGGAALFTLAARLVWLRAIGHYTSASS
ncbi:MAG TPA: ABC-2 family transporter protein [Polyangia bacterium]|nr:ABC-2 family transporter protein [Polyangia bacterium]